MKVLTEIGKEIEKGVFANNDVINLQFYKYCNKYFIT